MCAGDRGDTRILPAPAAAVIPRSGKGRQATKPNIRVELQLTVSSLKIRYYANSDVAVLHRPPVEAPPANSSAKSALPAALSPGRPARVPTVHRRHHKTAINGRSTEVEKWPPRRPSLAELPGRARRWIVHVMGGTHGFARDCGLGKTMDWKEPGFVRTHVSECPRGPSAPACRAFQALGFDGIHGSESTQYFQRLSSV